MAKTVIKTVKDIGCGLEGMNKYAAKSLNIRFPYSENTILIRSGLSRNLRRWTISHERRERQLMKSGKSYKEAHAEVLIQNGDYLHAKDALADADRTIRKVQQCQRTRRCR